MAANKAATSSAARDLAIANGEMRGVQDLVAVGVPDPGDDALASKDSLDLLRTCPQDLRQGAGVESGLEGSGPSEAIPGTSRGSRTTYGQALARSGFSEVKTVRPVGALERQPRGNVALALLLAGRRRGSR